MGEPRPRLLLVGGDGAPSGVPRHLSALADALQPMADVTVVSEPHRGGYGGLSCRHLSLPGLATTASLTRLRRGYDGVTRLIDQERPDLIWFHARVPVLLGRIAAAQGKLPCPFAVTFHGLPFGRGHRPALNAFGRRSERYLARHSPPHHMVFLTETQMSKMIVLLGASAQRHDLHILPNTSHLGPLPATPESSDGRHLVMTGRAGWQKNLEAAAALLPHLPTDIRLSICGPGTDAPPFATKLRRLAGGAAHRLALLGPLNDVRPLLAAADGYLLTSRYEGQPIGALEAWEAGLPVMLAPFDGAAELAQHPFSAVLESADPGARARQIEGWLTSYLTDRSTHQSQIKAGWARNHAPDTFAKNAQKLVQAWL